MSKLKGKHPSKNAYLTAYKASSKGAKHRAARIARHLKAHPEDVQTAKAASKAYKHRAKPQGKKAHSRALGVQEVAPNLWSYIPETAFKAGHPTLTMLKGVNFDKARKLRNAAKLSPEFVAVFLQ
jgi:hypothetical protein